ncbi:MAG TPA: endonuclease/exonuclease/phosphatase family protein [Thermomicrobiales bacterium]|jgi:exonuclease III
MRLISWNVARAGQTRIPYQVAALAARAPDIVALQEVRINRAAEYRSALQHAGFASVADSFAGLGADLGGKRASGVLIASRWECVVCAGARAEIGVPWPERLLSVIVATAWGAVEVHTVYVPVGYGGRDLAVRVETLERLYAGLARRAERHRILCGDFNLPQHEMADGEVITFGQTRRASGAFAITNAAMHAGEQKVLTGLAAFDLTDVYRMRHGYGRQEFSWYHPSSGNGFRLDHVLASRSLRARECCYLEAFRTPHPERYIGLGFNKLSDHAAMEVDFDPAPTGEPAVTARLISS